jgi:hypothetical protein
MTVVSPGTHTPRPHQPGCIRDQGLGQPLGFDALQQIHKAIHGHQRGGKRQLAKLPLLLQREARHLVAGEVGPQLCSAQQPV